MKEIYEIVKDKELIVKKKTMSLIEKIIRFYNLEINHNRYKEIILNKALPNTDFEFTIKRYYDAYLYLLNNTKNHLRYEIMKNVYFLMFNKEINENKLSKIISKAFFLSEEKDGFVEFHLLVYETFNELNDFERTVISLIFLNYMLVKIGIPNIRLTHKMLEKYMLFREEYFKTYNITKIKSYLLSILKEAEYQDKKYYKNLIAITKEDVLFEIKKNKSLIINKYNVKELYLFGSILDGSFRIDSDIDMYVIFKMDISFSEKDKSKKELKEFLFKTFNRFIDIQEIFIDITEDILNQTTKIMKIL